MPQTKIKIKTYRCQDCDYSQDFEPTQELMNLHFPEGIPAGNCPACYLGKCACTLGCKKGAIKSLPKEINPDKKTTLTIMGEEDIENEIIRDDEEKTKQGKIKMTEQEKIDYRLKRKQDIQDAIVKARLLED